MNDYRPMFSGEQPPKLKSLLREIAKWEDVETVNCYYSLSFDRVKISILTSYTKDGGQLALDITFSFEYFRRDRISLDWLIESTKMDFEGVKAAHLPQTNEAEK